MPNVVTFFLAGIPPGTYVEGAAPYGSIHLQMHNGEVLEERFHGRCDAGNTESRGAARVYSESLRVTCGNRPILATGSSELGSILTSEHVISCYGETTASKQLPNGGYAGVAIPRAASVAQNCAFSARTGGASIALREWHYSTVVGLQSGTYPVWTSGMVSEALKPADERCYSTTGACGFSANFTYNPAPNEAPCSMGTTNGARRAALMSISVADGGARCPAAPVVRGATAASISACADAYSGQICAATCDGALHASGELICQNGAWRGGFSCSTQRACALPTAPAAPVAGLYALPLIGIGGRNCGALTPVGTPCRILCNATAGDWGYGSIQCDADGEWSFNINVATNNFAECYAIPAAGATPGIEEPFLVVSPDAPVITYAGSNTDVKPRFGLRIAW
jgi:hypothetical protein